MKTNDRAPAAGWAAEAPEIRVGVTNSSVNTCGDCTVHHLLATSPTRDMLAAALMLAQNSYAVHWLRPRNKAPVAAGWSMAPVADVLTLSQTYRPGNNVGVRCGSWSQPMPDHGLVVVDVDIRAL